MPMMLTGFLIACVPFYGVFLPLWGCTERHIIIERHKVSNISSSVQWFSNASLNKITEYGIETTWGWVVYDN